MVKRGCKLDVSTVNCPIIGNSQRQVHPQRERRNNVSPNYSFTLQRNIYDEFLYIALVFTARYQYDINRSTYRFRKFLYTLNVGDGKSRCDSEKRIIV